MTKPCYFIARVTVHDPAAYEAYKTAAHATIVAAGGRYLVRGAEVAQVEGGAPDPRRLVILEFPDRASAEAWWNSPDYARAKAHRLGGVAEMQAELVEGL